MHNKTNNKISAAFIEEHRERVNRENLERLWKLEALDCLFTEVKDDPEDFHRLWMRPLLASGLTFESALAILIEGRFHPN
ncbi:MAG: hypothetical protein ABSH39_10470 [Candidatus Acidiferrum sp.]|jgi:hypothetical protein